MGGAQSNKGKHPPLQEMGDRSKELVKLMMPVYYNDAMISKDEHGAASSTWQMILSNTAPEFLDQRKRDPAFRKKFTTSIMYFSHCFYARLFNIHPMAKDLFKDMKSQGKFLVKMISLSLSELTDGDKFRSTLVKLAEIHNERGVKAVEYGVVGEVLIHAIRSTVGAEAFNPTVHLAWIKIYSRMLKTMVPVAVAHELRDNSAQTKRFLTNSLGVSGEEDLLNGMVQGSMSGNSN
mmetsp:Transcript_17811/g.29989  ORF Transcript_17811/g.29989 Transcript_17811/m.29989 type:complete len:235 (-) Transcript_17811:417-1121(-)